MILFLLAQAAVQAVPAPTVTPPASAPAGAAAPAAPAGEGVTRYDPSFFAAYGPANAQEMINRLPGFTLDAGSSVRGYEGAAGNVLIDGQRPATKTDTLDQLLYRMPASSIDHIDVIRGGAPGIDMQGKTVIANVVRKAGGAFHGLLAAQSTSLADGREYWAARAEGSGKLGPGTWEGGLLVGEGQDGGLGDGGVSTRDPSQKILSLGHIHAQGEGQTFTLNGAAEEPLWGGRIRLNARVNTGPYDSNESDTFTTPTLLTTREHQDDNAFQTEFGARYTHALGGRTRLETVLLRQDKTEHYADRFLAPGDTQLFHQDTTTAETIARAVVTFQQSSKVSWELGAEGADNTFSNRIRFSDNGAAIPLPAANVDVEEKRGELFGKVVWQLTPTLTAEGGVREEGSNIASSGDVVQEKTLYYTKPRALFTWSPDENTQVRLRFERSVGQLDFNSFVASTSFSAGVVTVGNPKLVPEQDLISEIAFERRFWGRGSAVITLRHTEISQAVDRAPIFGAGTGVFDAPANIGDGTKDEESLNLTVPLDRLGVKGGRFLANSTWRQSQVIDPTTHQPREISGLHPVDWDLHFTQDLPVRHMDWGVDLYGQQRERYYRFNVIETRKYESQLDPFIEWKPRPDLQWRFEVDNAVHRSFKRFDDNFAGPRNISTLALIQARAQQPSRVFSIRVRKLFGV
ncbi:MAG: TonB-dependent receptor [Proteobacteria bacterium]|nr:TonB-dependent receptor [Pseudomonadota bacterium]